MIPAPGRRSLDRILDANVNRAAEGLRTLEEVARFILDDGALAQRCKNIRHQVRNVLPATIVASRDVAGDVGTAYQSGAQPRAHLIGHIRANAARAQEALRAAEEAARLVGLPAAAVFETARYAAYSLESALLSRLPAWRLWQVRVYVLVDTALCAEPVAVAQAAVRGGAGAIQLRAKGLPGRAYRELAARMQAAVAEAGAFFVVNDHVDIAAVLAADAIHVGQADLAVADVRAVVGPLTAIGMSCHTHEQLITAQGDGADYVGLGPMFATTTKPHEPCRGPELLDQVRAELRVPSYAIGGLDPARIATLGTRIPHGVALAGTVCRAADPERATAEIVDLLEREDPLLAGRP